MAFLCVSSGQSTRGALPRSLPRRRFLIGTAWTSAHTAAIMQSLGPVLGCWVPVRARERGRRLASEGRERSRMASTISRIRPIQPKHSPPLQTVQEHHWRAIEHRLKRFATC